MLDLEMLLRVSRCYYRITYERVGWEEADCEYAEKSKYEFRVGWDMQAKSVILK